MGLFNFGGNTKKSSESTALSGFKTTDLNAVVNQAQAEVGQTASSYGKDTTQVEGVQLDQAAIDKIIQDVLGGADGLASIFGGEHSSGIYNSSVAAQAAGDLASKLVGEIATLTAKRITTSGEAGKQLDQKGNIVTQTQNTTSNENVNFAQQGKNNSKETGFNFSYSGGK